MPDPVDGLVDAKIDPYRTVPLPLIDGGEARRRRHERRRRVAVVKNVLPAIAIAIALAVVSHLDDGRNQRPTPGAPGGPATAEPAVWKVDLARPPQREALSFTALVSRLGCEEAGDVLVPQVIENPISVVVIFNVTSQASGSTGGCTVGAPVPYSVPLGTPLGGRTLFDGTCDLPPASTTSACVTAQRWPLNG